MNWDILIRWSEPLGFLIAADIGLFLVWYGTKTSKNKNEWEDHNGKIRCTRCAGIIEDDK